jgi:ketosteroid isomerase-like protein
MANLLAFGRANIHRSNARPAASFVAGAKRLCVERRWRRRSLRDTRRTMSQENVEILSRLFEAFNSEDIEHILTFAHPDLEIEVPPEISAEPDTYRGHDGMRRYFQSFQDAMNEIRFLPERFWDLGGSMVVVSLLVTAKGRQTAIQVAQRTTGVWTIRDGKVIRVRAYASPSEALQAVGLEA